MNDKKVLTHWVNVSRCIWESLSISLVSILMAINDKTMISFCGHQTPTLMLSYSTRSDCIQHIAARTLIVDSCLADLLERPDARSRLRECVLDYLIDLFPPLRLLSVHLNLFWR